MQPHEKTIPWWRRALNRALDGIRSGFGLFSRLSKPAIDVEPKSSDRLEETPEEETALIDSFSEPKIVTETENSAAEAESRIPSATDAAPAAAVEEAEAVTLEAEAIDLVQKSGIVLSHPSDKNEDAARVGHPVHGAIQNEQIEPEATVEIAEAEAVALEAEAIDLVQKSDIVLSHPSGKNEDAARVGHPVHGAIQEEGNELEIEKEPAATDETVSEPVPAVVDEAQPAERAAEAGTAPEASAGTAAQLVLTAEPTAEEEANKKAEEKNAAKLAARQKKLDESAEESPFSVVVGQVYDGPLDLLLDLIRKQDIDIYDIPIAKITSQFLAYVNQLKAGDVDVAGEFIYMASLLIHIKSKMLLPRAPSGPEEEAEDPRQELVERLLEHERFKNAAQMLQQKQMLEAASWSNPGLREFKDDVAAEPEIAADTVDLIRVFSEILERARKRPVLDVTEDSVTVGQMIQFLARRLTMEDKPIALRRLLSHTRSERALIAMFLALLELVRLQAILLRQDRAFSEIFIKKHTDFDTVMNEGFVNAHDDWR
jgi:segregation and condensation protein A